jgi:excisionase family DNA binding protein
MMETIVSSNAFNINNSCYLLTVQQAAALLRCGKRKVFALMAEGKLRRVRFGARTHVGAESVTALLAPPPATEPKVKPPRRLSNGFVPFSRSAVR